MTLGTQPFQIKLSSLLIIGGDHESALKNLKQMISADPSDSDTWNAFSSYFSSIGLSGRAKACEEKAESLT